MTDFGNDDQSALIINGIDNSIVSLPHSISVFFGFQLLAPARTRIVRQAINASHNPLAIFLAPDQIDFLGSRRLDLKLISFHVASATGRHRQNPGWVHVLDSQTP